MRTKPLSFREVIESVIPHSQKIPEMPKRVTDKTLDTLCEEGLIVKGSPGQLIEQLRSLKPEQVLQLPDEYVTPKHEVNYIIKNLRGRDVVNLMSSSVLEATIDKLHFAAVGQGETVTLPESYLNARYKRLSAKLAKEVKLYPYYLIKEGLAQLKGTDAAPIAYSWYGTDRKARAVPFFRAYEAAVMFAAHLRGELEIDFPDGKFRGKNIRVRVESLDKAEEDLHILNMTSLSIFEKDDPWQHYFWVDTEGSCNCLDKSSTSMQHDKRARNTNVFCKHEIAAYLAAMRYLTRTKQFGPGYHFRINPFGIPTKHLAKLMEVALTRTFIKKRDPNKTELSRVIGRYAVETDYDGAFYNWGKRDFRGRPRQLEKYL